MKSFQLIAAILHGTWLVDKNYAANMMPLVVQLLKGEQVNFGQQTSEQEEYVTPVKVSASAYKTYYGSNLDLIPHGSVAIVDLKGPITRYGGMCSYGTQHKAELLRKLNNANNVCGVLLDVDTPGGEAAGLGMFADTIKQMSKPVLAIVDDGICASGGMWAVSNCNEIYATNKQTEFGSIGAYTMIADWLGYYEKEGLKVHEIYSRLSEDKNKAYREALEGNYELMQDGLDDLVNTFIAQVRTGRKSKLTAKAEKAFKGGMYDATEAKAMGLIDGIISYDAAIQRVKDLSQKNNRTNKNTTMSTKKTYTHIAKTANWENGHEATEEGLHLTHEDAAAIDAALEQGANATAQLATKEAELATANTALETANEALATANARIAELEAEPANDGTETANPKTQNEPGGKQTKRVDPVTEMAQKIYNLHHKES